MEILAVLAKIVAVLLIVLLNGFFVAAEFAIVKIRLTQLEPLLRGGDKRARVAHHIATHLRAAISATQLGITVTSLALGWVGEPFVADLLRPLFVVVGVQSRGLIDTISFGIAFAAITFLHIVLGELAPKSLAIQRTLGIALGTARPLHLFATVFRPFISALNGSATALLKFVGLTPASENDLANSQEELRLLLSRGKAFSSTGRSILLNAIEMQNRSVREIMVPRTSIVSLSTADSLERNIAAAVDNQFTRYPLCEGNLDNIVGMVHIKDLFKLRGMEGKSIADIRREILFVPETMPLERILGMFLARRILMAIAVDEYGGTAGLVTLENVLEELVGDIRDEFDVEPLMVQKVRDDEFLVDGSMALHDFARMFDVTPDSRDVVTVSGYVIQLCGRVPERGTTLKIGSWQAHVEGMDGGKIKTVRIKKIPAEAGVS